MISFFYASLFLEEEVRIFLCSRSVFNLVIVGVFSVKLNYLHNEWDLACWEASLLTIRKRDKDIKIIRDTLNHVGWAMLFLMLVDIDPLFGNLYTELA